MDQSILQKVMHLQQSIQLEAESGIQGSSYKDRLKDMFKQILDSLNQRIHPSLDFNEFKLQLIKQIKPSTKVYKQLNEDIFN